MIERLRETADVLTEIADQMQRIVELRDELQGVAKPVLRLVRDNEPAWPAA
jgi:hypothetical protein